MIRIGTLIFLGVLVCAPLLLISCAPATPGPPSPASEFCHEQGGQVQIRDDESGPLGYCIFPDGSECEEWAFFRGDCAPGESIIGLPNPASVHCEEQGGTLDVREGDGGQVGYCIFPDGSECEEWAFFRGDCAPSGPLTATPDPASLFCHERGGTVELRPSQSGELSFCVFPDGSACEEWAFFRGRCSPKSRYQPVGGSVCTTLALDVSAELAVETTSSTEPFQDYISGESGFCCQIAAVGTGADFESFPAVAETVRSLLISQGWKEDRRYVADSPTGAATGFAGEASLCLFRVGWEPALNADCDDGQPVTECELGPEQQEYEVVLQCAQDTAAAQ